MTGNKSDNYERRAPGTAGMRDGVRYQIYESSDTHILFMASEQEFWRNFCEGVGRMDLFERWPGSKFADHAKGNTELRKELAAIFKTKSTAEWVEWSGRHNTTIAPVNTPETLAEDAQFKERLGFIPRKGTGADMEPYPVKFVGETAVDPAPAPTVGEHTDEILRDVLGYDADRIAALRNAEALGSAPTDGAQ